MLHVSRKLSYICLQERGFLKRISYCRTGYLLFINRIVIFTGLVQGILRWCIGYCSFCIEFCILKKVAANWKTCYIWYKHIVLFFTGILYHLKDHYTFWQGMLHPLEIPPFCVGLKNHCIISKENCKWTNTASLQAGGRSLLHATLHSRAGMPCVKLMLNIIATYFPSKEGCTSFKGTLHLLEQNTLYFARDGGWVYATISVLLGCTYILKCLFLNCVYA